MSLKISDIKEGTTFYEFGPQAQKAEFVAICDGHLYIDENNNEYWRVYGKNVKTREEVKFLHLVGFSNYPRLYNYEAYGNLEDYVDPSNEGC